MFLDTLNKTILNIWPQLTIFIVVLVAVRIFALRNSSKKISFHEEFLNLLFIVYILLLFEIFHMLFLPLIHLMILLTL